MIAKVAKLEKKRGIGYIYRYSKSVTLSIFVPIIVLDIVVVCVAMTNMFYALNMHSRLLDFFGTDVYAEVNDTLHFMQDFQVWLCVMTIDVAVFVVIMVLYFFVLLKKVDYSTAVALEIQELENRIAKLKQ